MEKERHGEDAYIGRCMEKCAGFGWRLRLRGRRVRKIETLRRFIVTLQRTDQFTASETRTAVGNRTDACHGFTVRLRVSITRYRK